MRSRNVSVAAGCAAGAAAAVCGSGDGAVDRGEPHAATSHATIRHTRSVITRSIPHRTTQRKRARKLLMHKREISKFADKAMEKGFTLVPLKMYFKEGRAKVLMGVCKGKQKHDKRESLKQRDSKREIDRAMKRGR